MENETDNKKQSEVYINSPFRPSTARRVKALAKRNRRSAGRQVEWIVERFFKEGI